METISQLRSLLDQRKDLRTAIEAAIRTAAIPDIADLQGFYGLLERMLKQVPSYPAIDTELGYFHLVISSSPDNILEEDKAFNDWLSAIAADHGSWLDTLESARLLESFINHPDFHIEEYLAPHGGWLTFNQFFTRHVKPGKRPIAGACNDKVIVSPADSTYLGCWPIDKESCVTVKGVKYVIHELLKGSKYRNEFRNGIFTHSYLSMTDYHRFHVPAGGAIREIVHIPGRVIAHTVKGENGEADTKDEVGFQFRQTRALVILETAAGLIAMIPVGMGHVSSVIVTAELDDYLVKGEEFGYFCYGGSDMIMLFQPDRIELTADVKVHYKQGQAVGKTLS